MSGSPFFGPHAETADSSGNVEFVRDSSGTLVAMQTSAGSYYYTTDALGSTILLTDPTDSVAAQYTYQSYGGGYTDPSGLIKFGTRYYDDYSGTFTQQDPAHQGSNLYAYTNDDPVNLTDPTGRGILGDVVGGLEELNGLADAGFGAFVIGTSCATVLGCVVGYPPVSA